MKEKHPPPQLQEDTFRDYYDSPFLTLANDIHVVGDPETAEEFATTLSYLGLISSHFVESDELWQKTAADVIDRLTYYNQWHKYEVEQEHRTGETSTTYREVTIHHLRALSERRVRAMEDTGWEVTQFYRMALFFHKLVEQAAASAREMDELLGIAVPAAYLSSTSDEDTGIPF